MRVLAILLTAALTAAGARDASAQASSLDEPTRAGEAEAARQAKAADLHANMPTRVESALLYVEDARLLGRIFNPPAGWFAQVGGLTEGAGFALGGGYRRSIGPAGVVDLRGLGSIGRAFLVDATWRSDPDGVDRVGFHGGVALQRHANQRFYGLGRDSDREADSDFTFDERRLDGGLDVRMTPWLTVTAGAGLSRIALADLDYDDDDDDDPPSPFRDPALPGATGRPTFASVSAGIVVDSRDLDDVAGTRLAIRQTVYRDRSGSSHDFSATRLEVQQFVPVWSGARVFAFSVLADRTEAGVGQTVPFYLQPTVGGNRSLRGFDRQRFRDASALVLQAEYRYEVNPFVSGALFVDTGQVAAGWARLRRDKFRSDYGIGLRLGYGRVVAIRTDVAFGGEGPRVIIALNGVF